MSTTEQPAPGSRKPIVVVGSINMDLVANAERIPLAGETVSGTFFHTYPGGKGANQAVAVARLGYPVLMIGKLGDDHFGAELRSSLEADGVDTRGIGTIKNVSSGIAMIVVSPHGENCIVIAPGANGRISPEDLDANLDIICQAGIVLTQLEIPLETVEHLAQICSSHHIPLMLDPAPAVALPPAILDGLTWFTPNETEAAYYAGTQAVSSRDVRDHLFAQGIQGLIFKLGASGSRLVMAQGREENIPSFPVKANDTTAAGDAFNGAFATALMLGLDPVEGARFASAASAISVTRAGAQPSMPSMAEVNAMLVEGRLAVPAVQQ